MLAISHAPSSIASAVPAADTSDSSRQIGVAISAASTRVADDVVLGQRLLDQQQVEVVESPEVGAVGAAVGGVGVDLERGVGADQVADGGHLLDVVARLDLQLDPYVAVVDVPLHGGEQLVDRVVDADAHPARDAGGGDAEEVGERAVLRTELGVEDGHLQRPLGHRMAVQLGEARSHVGGVERAAGHQPGEQVVDHHVLRAVDVLGGVARVAERHALAPALGALPSRRLQLAAHEEDVALGLAPEARAERRDQRHGDAAQLDSGQRPRRALGHGVDPIT